MKSLNAALDELRDPVGTFTKKKVGEATARIQRVMDTNKDFKRTHKKREMFACHD